MVSANLCACALLVLLIFSTKFRKMSTGTDGRVFMVMLFSALIMTLADTTAIILNNFTVSTGIILPAGVTAFRYVLHSIYLILRNLTVPFFIIYLAALSDRWHKLMSSPLKPVLFLAYAVFDVLMILTNPWTKLICYFDETGAYTRGPAFFILYIGAALYSAAFIWYLISIRKLINPVQFYALVSLCPINATAVLMQFLRIDFQIEMFVTAISLMLVTICVQRPEEIIDTSTHLRNSNAYADDMGRNFSNNKHVKIIMINVSNLDSIISMLDYEAASELTEIISRKVESTAAQYLKTSKCYYLSRGKFRIVDGSHSQDIYLAAEELNSFFRKGIIINRLELNLLAHIGIISCPEDISDFRSLILFGNDFHVKYPYTGNVITGAELNVKNSFILSRNLDNIIEKAIAKGNFKVYYQPIYSVKKQKFTAAEALLRLIDDEYGFVPPDIFIPAAEKSGAIHKIGDFVLEDVCRFISSPEFVKLGLEYIEINLSVAQCMQTDLAEKILGIVNSHNVITSKINLEITETAASYAQNVMTSNVDKLISEGISFSLDDYGTGYSNIKSIVSLPLSIVKLDKSFADQMNNSKMETVLKDTVHMLKNLDMQIVVEGIETKDMLLHFTELGCDFIQGYYFSKPLPESDFVSFISEKNFASV